MLCSALPLRSRLPVPAAASVVAVVEAVTGAVVEEVEEHGVEAPGAARDGLRQHDVHEAARARRQHHGRRLRAVRPLQPLLPLALRRQARARRRLLVRRGRRQRRGQVQVQASPAAAAPAHLDVDVDQSDRQASCSLRVHEACASLVTVLIDKITDANTRPCCAVMLLVICSSREVDGGGLRGTRRDGSMYL
jgi:hypothetical protein